MRKMDAVIDFARNHPLLTSIAAYYFYDYAKTLATWKNVEGEVVLITGGSGGLGFSLARQFILAKSKVVLWDLREADLLRAATELEKELGVRPSIFVCDVTDRNAVLQTAKKVESTVGVVTILVNNAAIMPGKPLLETSPELIERCLQVNTISLFWTTRAFLPQMIAQKKGHIVTIASTAGIFQAPGIVPYCASKAAAIGFSRALRIELNHLGHDYIGTTEVCPYAISTPLAAGWKDPVGTKTLQPDDVAKDILWAVQHNVNFLILPPSMFSHILVQEAFPKLYHSVAELVGVGETTKSFTGRSEEFMLGKSKL